MSQFTSRQRRLATGVAAIFVTGTVALAPMAHADTAPDPDFDAAWGGEPFYEEEQLATNEDGVFPNYRIPALTVANNGDLLASYDGRPTGIDSPGPNSVLQRRSTDNGQTWGPQTYIREGDTEDPIEGYSDPSYIVDRETGNIFNFHVFSMDAGFRDSEPGTDPEDRNVIHANVSRSEDNGETWTHETITDDITNDEGWRSRFAAAGQGIQLRYGDYAGRMIQQFTIINGDGDYQAVSVYSDDGGDSWQAGEPVGVGMDENKTVELSDGRVMLNSRDSHGSDYRKVTISEDGGHSYGEVTLDEQLPDPVNNASIVRAFPNAPEGSDEAAVLLFSNAASTSTRGNGTVRMSCDDGETWPVSRVFQEGGMAYSTLVTQPDGTIGLLYEPDGGGGGIRYANFNLSWLQEGGICASVTADGISLDAGATAEAEVTVTNQSAGDLTSGVLSFDAPAGWEIEDTEVPTIDGGESATVSVPVTVPDDAFAGSYTVEVNLTTDQGTSSGSFTTTVNADQDQLITVVPQVTNQSDDGEYLPGERLNFSYSVTNVSQDTISVVPESENLENFNPPEAPNCRFGNLAPGASYTCDSSFALLGEEDLAAGSFTPQTTWRVLDGGFDADEIGVVERNAPTVETRAPENLIAQSGISLFDVSSEESESSDDVAVNAIDGDQGTFWHSAWSDSEGPHHITLDLGENYAVEGLRYLPRQSGGTNGMLEDYEIYVSGDGENWGEPAAAGTLDQSNASQAIEFDPAEGRYVQLVFLSSYSDGGNHFASAAELNVHGVLVEDVEPTEKPTEEPTEGSTGSSSPSEEPTEEPAEGPEEPLPSAEPTEDSADELAGSAGEGASGDSAGGSAGSPGNDHGAAVPGGLAATGISVGAAVAVALLLIGGGLLLSRRRVGAES